MKVAVVQFNARNKKAENISRGLRFVKKAARAGAQFVLLPETFNFRGTLDSRLAQDDVFETIPGESTRPFLVQAKELGVFILLGSVYERSFTETNRAYNSSVLISRDGKILAKYRKVNLFNAVIGAKTIRESQTFLPGDKPTTVRVGDFNVGLSICYDLRFPEFYRQYAARGCHVMTVPASFTRATGKAHWETLLRARAIENLCYVLAPNQCGKDGRGVATFGNSLIIGPWGDVLARGSSGKEEILYADLQMKAIRKAREALPGVIK